MISTIWVQRILLKSAIYRLNEQNKITRILDGLYTKPKYSEVLNEYSFPDSNLIV